MIIASPYLRTLQTAQIIQREFRRIRHHVDIVIDDRIGEWSYAHAYLQNHDHTILPRPGGYNSITPADWNRSVLAQEITLESGPSHIRRIQAVLEEYHTYYNQAIVVTHHAAVLAAYPSIDISNPPIIQQGDFVIAISNLSAGAAVQECLDSNNTCVPGNNI